MYLLYAGLLWSWNCLQTLMAGNCLIQLAMTCRKLKCKCCDTCTKLSGLVIHFDLLQLLHLNSISAILAQIRACGSWAWSNGHGCVHCIDALVVKSNNTGFKEYCGKRCKACSWYCRIVVGWVAATTLFGQQLYLKAKCLRTTFPSQCDWTIIFISLAYSIGVAHVVVLSCQERSWLSHWQPKSLYSLYSRHRHAAPRNSTFPLALNKPDTSNIINLPYITQCPKRPTYHIAWMIEGFLP